MSVSEVIAAGSTVSSLLSEGAVSEARVSQEQQKAGRPKGSIKEKKQEEATKYKMCTHAIVDSYILELGA